MKKISIFIVLILLSLFLISCNKYEDTNGDDDYSLEHITDEAIIDNSGKSITNIGMAEINTEISKTRSVLKANGVETLAVLDGNVTYKINLRIDITKGNAKVVLVCEGKIVYEFKLNEENDYIYHLGGDSLTYLKIACESLEYELNYTIKEVSELKILTSQYELISQDCFYLSLENLIIT